MNVQVEQGQRFRLWIEEKFNDKKEAATALGMKSDTGLYRYFKGEVQIGSNLGDRIKALAGEDTYFWIMTGTKKESKSPSPEEFEQNKDILIAELFRRIIKLEKQWEENAVDLKKINNEAAPTSITSSSLKNISNSTKSGATPIR